MVRGEGCSPVVHRKFFRPWSRPWRVVKVISDATYRIQCEEVAPLRARRKMRLIVHFNRLEAYRIRPTQLQPSLDDVEEDKNRSTNLNVEEHAVMRPPLTTDSDGPDTQVRRSARSRLSPAWMGDFLLGKDFTPLQTGVCNVAKRPLGPGPSWLRNHVLLL